MDAPKTSLSIGELICEILTENAEVKSRTTNIFPVATDKAKLPYILYRRAGMEQAEAKGISGADTVALEINCFTEKYQEGVELAESVRSALDNNQAVSADGKLRMRSCVLADGEEAWQDDAYVQQLIFNIKV